MLMCTSVGQNVSDIPTAYLECLTKRSSKRWESYFTGLISKVSHQEEGTEPLTLSLLVRYTYLAPQMSQAKVSIILNSLIEQLGASVSCSRTLTAVESIEPETSVSCFKEKGALCCPCLPWWQHTFSCPCCAGMCFIW